MPEREDNYYFKPANAAGEGTFYYLQETEPAEGACFVLVPYAAPSNRPLPIRYFKVIRQVQGKLDPGPEQMAPVEFRRSMSHRQYIDNVLKLKEHIQRGDIYEINFCQEFTATATGIDPEKIFGGLYQLSKAPYAGLLKLGSEYILSGSPELFLKREGERLITKPIKGTARRGITAAEDQQLKEGLYRSEKDRTENVMAVDVARNDLSQLAQKASVKVNRLYNIETFETVHQMVSTVECRLGKNFSVPEILACTFPMASMTGAPKMRAMQLIEKYEHFERGYYSGCMGLVQANGDFELSVLIRSIFYNSEFKTLRICAGGAITHLSDPEQEYEECMLKAAAMLRVLNGVLKD